MSTLFVRKYRKLSSAELLDLYLQKGNIYAFQALYERYEQRLWAVYNRRVSHVEDRKDLIQQVYEELLKSKGLREGKVEVYERYLMGIAFNVLNAYYRRKKREYACDFASESLPPKVEAEIPEVMLEPSESQLLEQKVAGLYEAIQQLSPKQQTAIQFQLQQMSYLDIAEKMETTVTVVGSLINRAKGRLKKLMLKEKPDEDRSKQ